MYLCNMLKAIDHIKKELNGLYPETEIKSFVNLLISKITGLSVTGIIVNKNTIFSVEQREILNRFIEKLKLFTPIQYILGETTFMDSIFEVNEAVLIPRPETEELVEWIIQCSSKAASGFKILDIGTGSGCIAVSLQKYLPQASVMAFDISYDALEVARRNALSNGVAVGFRQFDILSDEKVNFSFDLIVSNPPYITESEKKDILPNVLDFEPHIALFVPENDPLLFYRKIIQFACHFLSPGGQLFFEIHRDRGLEITALLKNYDFTEIELRQDISGNDRMIRAIKI